MMEWTTTDIARELGLADAAVARSFIRRSGLQAVGRTVDTSEKLYNATEVRAARDRMPGRGVGGGRPTTPAS